MHTAAPSFAPLPQDFAAPFLAVSAAQGACFMSPRGPVAIHARGEWSVAALPQPSRFVVEDAGGFLLLEAEGPTAHVDLRGKITKGPVAAGPRRNLVGGALAWDRARQRALLFGGSYFEKGKTQDQSALWSWERGAWTAVKAKGKPVARSGALAAWVPTRESLVVIGGFHEKKGHQTDTLEFDGKTWTSYPDSIEPDVVGRPSVVLAWDERSGQLLHGRFDGSSGCRLYRYLGQGRWEQLALIQALYDGCRVAYAADTRQLLFMRASENAARAHWASLDIGSWLDALPAVDRGASEATRPAIEIAPVTTAPPTAPRRYLSFREDGADKFWFAELEGSTYTLRWGRRGTTGQSKTYTLDSPEKAARELDKKVRAKLDGGYADAPEGAAAAEVPGRDAFVMTFVPSADGRDDQIFGAPPFALEAWPTCRTCSEPMEHLATLRAHSERLPLTRLAALALFQCATPSCPAWELDGGANALLGVSAEALAAGPTNARSSVAESEAQTVRYAAPTRETEPGEDDDERSPSGSKLGGHPTWVHAPEDPEKLRCAVCAKPLRFIGQLDSGDTGMSFGDVGLGYLFFCPDEHSGKFASQG